MNKCHPNIKFTMESEINNTLPYLDILITRHSDGKLTNNQGISETHLHWSLSEMG